VFARAYAGVEPTGEPLVLDPPDAATWLAGIAPEVVGGSGLRAFPQLLEAVPEAVRAPLEVAAPRARHVALYALSAHAIPYTEVEPVYLRPPDVTPPKQR